MIKAGDKVKFNEETKKLYASMINDPYHKGAPLFCEELLKAGGIDSEFTVKAVIKTLSKPKDESKVREVTEITLNELPGCYFKIEEFTEKKEIPIIMEEAPVKVKPVEVKEMKSTKTVTEAYLGLCEQYHRQKEINKDLVDEINQKDRIIRAFDEDTVNLESDVQELKEIIRKLLNVKDENYNNVLERYASAELLEEAGEYTGE